MKVEDNPVLFSEVIETVRDANKEIEDEESGNRGSSDFNMFKETGELLDEESENDYQKYVKRKNKERKILRDRKDWKETKDDWLNNSTMAKGNAFNRKGVN